MELNRPLGDAKSKRDLFVRPIVHQPLEDFTFTARQLNLIAERMGDLKQFLGLLLNAIKLRFLNANQDDVVTRGPSLSQAVHREHAGRPICREVAIRIRLEVEAKSA